MNIYAHIYENLFNKFCKSENFFPFTFYECLYIYMRGYGKKKNKAYIYKNYLKNIYFMKNSYFSIKDPSFLKKKKKK